MTVVKTILSILGKPESLISYVTDRPGYDLRYAIDPTKITTELGWVSEMSFEEGIAQTIQWFLNHED